MPKIHSLDDINRAKENPTDPKAVSAAFSQIMEIIKDLEKQIHAIESRAKP